MPSRIFSSACCTPSPGDVAGDRRVVGLAGDLVDLVDVDDPGLGLLDVVVGGLDQLQQDVLDVLADVAGLGQRRRVGDRERDVEDPRQRLGEQRLAAAGRAEQQDVRLLQLDPPRRSSVCRRSGRACSGCRRRPRAPAWRRPGRPRTRSRIVVDLLRLGQVLELEARRRGQLLVDDLVAEVDALVADVDAGAGDQLLDLALRLAAEAAEELLVRVGWACQWVLPSGRAAPGSAGVEDYGTLQAGLARSCYSAGPGVPARGAACKRRPGLRERRVSARPNPGRRRARAARTRP